MQKVKNTIRVCFIYVAALLIAGGYPAAVSAQAVETPSTQATETQTTTLEKPAKPETTYTYDKETKRWNTNEWQYSPATNTYQAVTPPAPVTSDKPEPTATNNPTATQQQATDTQQDTDASTTIDTTTDASIDNNLTSDAETGDATVTRNTDAGDATSGDASSIANIMNTINSSVSGDGAEFASFVSDVTGDVHGDILLYPMLLKAMLQATEGTDSDAGDTTVNTDTSASITNDIDLSAGSGDASVTENTNAGSATTGTANTVANVMNFINSIIAANQSFVGTINIHGNLDGDILVAPDFIPELLASNNGSSAPAGSVEVNAENTQSIVNNLNLNATTGEATVANNTNAGNATTGDATTNVTILNLSGHQIVANNSLLVFVNVLGEWVGIIVDAPTGTTAAAIGSGVTSHTTDGTDVAINADNNAQIVNNINLDSHSGDATVARNTNAGNATTGDATASANIANVVGSQMGLSDWFGILFINVFGSWYGSFGVDTDRGNQPPATSSGGNDKTPNKRAPEPQPGQVFQFVADQTTAATTTGTSHGFATSFASLATDVTEQTPESQPVNQKEDTKTVLGVASAPLTPEITAPAAQSKTEQPNVLPFVTGAFLLGLGVIATKNIVTFIRGRGGTGL